MKIPKQGNYFRLSEEIRASLEVLAEMAESSYTEILEACVRVGKKTVAKTRGLDYQELLNNIKARRKDYQLERIILRLKESESYLKWVRLQYHIFVNPKATGAEELRQLAIAVQDHPNYWIPKEGEK